MRNRCIVRISRWTEVVGLVVMMMAATLVVLPARAAVPGEAQNLNWCSGSKDCLQWSATTGASQYRVYRGEQASINCLTSATLDSCLESIFASATTGVGAIPDTPAPGRFYWFLVTAENGTGEGPSGNDRLSGIPQPRVRNTFGSCPGSCTSSGGGCVAPSDCCSSNCAGACQTACCAPTGALCGIPADCCSNICVGAQCQPCLALGQSCNSSASCCSGNCTGNVCVAPCQPNGDTCLGSSQCCSGNCTFGLCQPCIPNGGSCASGSCCSGNCVGGTCQAACTPNGGSCAIGSQCCSGLCTGNVCQAPCGPNGSSCVTGTQCCSGVCISNVCQCNAGYADCNANPGDGCEVNLLTNTSNCGNCGNVCSSANGTPSCSGGQCQISCNAGFSNCNNNAADGCEINTNTSVNNCGTCGSVCSFQNASAACVGGACTIASCNAGYGDCNGNPADGCEIYFLSDNNNCGNCGHTCAFPNGSGSCVNGTCTLTSCNAGFANCNANPADGCEINTNNNTSNCGNCGNTCAFQNASAACTGGTCTIASCNFGYADCNANPADGCELNILTNTSNCGNCGAVCSSANGIPSCSGGQCQISCNSGFGNCNNNAADGCEINLLTNNNNCGTCGHVCPMFTFCQAGACFAP